MSKHNGAINWERHAGTLLVFVPAVKWYQLGVPYGSELERVLRPATNDEERAIVIAPDKTTLRYLRLESYPAQIQIVMDEREARRLAELGQASGIAQPPVNGSYYPSSNGESSVTFDGNRYEAGRNSENGNGSNGNGTHANGNGEYPAAHSNGSYRNGSSDNQSSSNGRHHDDNELPSGAAFMGNAFLSRDDVSDK